MSVIQEMENAALAYNRAGLESSVVNLGARKYSTLLKELGNYSTRAFVNLEIHLSTGPHRINCLHSVPPDTLYIGDNHILDVLYKLGVKYTYRRLV